MDLHGFADASKEAYAAVVYVTVRGVRTRARLLASKTRVALVKVQTIPRLELCAATLLAELLHKLRDVFSEQVRNIHVWSDTTVTLAWISAEPSRWEVFVANRVSKIQRLLPGIIWKHVSSEDYPADLASHGTSAVKLEKSCLWWQGPPWLSQHPSTWPTQPVNATPICSVVQGAQRAGRSDPPIGDNDFIERFSRLESLLRAIARCLRFLRLGRPGGRELLVGPITVLELNTAFYKCVSFVQALSFQREISVLRRGYSLGRGDRLSALSPFLDTQGVLRV